MTSETARHTAGLYLSGFKPRGVRKDWDRCSMNPDSTTKLLASFPYGGGAVTEAVAWFAEKGDLRTLVANLDTGRQVTLRRSGRDWKMTFARLSTFRAQGVHRDGNNVVAALEDAIAKASGEEG